MPRYGKPDDDNPEWTKEDFRRSRKFEGLPVELQQALSKPRRGPQKAPTKVLVSMRLSPDVVEALRATGAGWQVRADEALRNWIKRQAIDKQQPVAESPKR